MAIVATVRRVFDIQFAMLIPIFRAARCETPKKTYPHRATNITFAQSRNKIYIGSHEACHPVLNAAMRHSRTIGGAVAAHGQQR